MPTHEASPSIHVIGAGIVGICCAWWLRREGFDVTVIEKDLPGDAASLGNSGSIGLASVPPLGMPGMTTKAPRWMLDPMHALTVRWRYLPKALPWFLRFAMNTRHDSVEAIADARAALLSQAGDAFDALLGEIGQRQLIEPRGLLQVFESENGLAGAQYALDMRRKRGIRFEEKTGDEMREMEPALSDRIKGGVWFPDVRMCVNPQRMTKVIAEAFVAAGGKLLRAEVKGFDIGPDGPRRIVTDQGVLDCERGGAGGRRVVAGNGAGTRLPSAARSRARLSRDDQGTGGGAKNSLRLQRAQRHHLAAGTRPAYYHYVGVRRHRRAGTPRPGTEHHPWRRQPFARPAPRL
jgi:glycine/D-amino acid oxidase-like deaminating enzyme